MEDMKKLSKLGHCGSMAMAALCIVVLSCKGGEQKTNNDSVLVAAADSIVGKEPVDTTPAAPSVEDTDVTTPAAPSVEDTDVTTAAAPPAEDTDITTTVLDPMSPYWYDPEQTKVTFTEKRDTLLRFPRIKKGGHYVIPSTVRHIFDRAFLGCRELTAVTIPRTVKSIEMAAFDGCPKLKSVYVYAQLDTIPFRFLSGCSSLREIYLNIKIPPVAVEYEDDEQICYNFFFPCDRAKKIVLHVPKGTAWRYRKARVWRLFSNIRDDM